MPMKLVKIREEHYVEAVAISQEVGCTIGEGLRLAGVRAHNEKNSGPSQPSEMLEPILFEPQESALSW